MPYPIFTIFNRKESCLPASTQPHISRHASRNIRLNFKRIYSGIILGKNAINATKLYYTHMNLHLYRKKSIHNRIHNYSHMTIFAVCLQSDRESYNWGLSSISVGLKPIYIKWTPVAKNKG